MKTYCKWTYEGSVGLISSYVFCLLLINRHYKVGWKFSLFFSCSNGAGNDDFYER